MELVLTINYVTSDSIFVTVAQAQTASDFARVRESLTAGILSFEPEERRMLGDPTAAGHLKDWSAKAIAEEVDFCRAGLKQLNAVQIATPAERLDREMLAAHLTYLEYYYGQYHGELGNLQITVYPYELIQYELQRFDTGAQDAASAGNHYGAVAEILLGLPRYLDQQEVNLVSGLKLRQPDREILVRMIKRIRFSSKDDNIHLAFCPPASSDKDDSICAGLDTVAERLESPEIRSLLSIYQKEMLRYLLGRAKAAYDRHADFLKSKLLPQARDSWALGKDEYRRRFALIYGNHIALDKLVQEAEADLHSLKGQMEALANKLGLGSSLSNTLEALSQHHPATTQELLKSYEQVQEKIDNSITRRLGLQVPAPRYLLAPPGVPVSPATNWPAPLLSLGLGIVLVSSSEKVEDNPFADLPWIAVHEGNPGHAAQSFLFQKAFREGSVPLCRFLNIPDEVGYVRGDWSAMANIEGWAFYTERLLLASELLTPKQRLAALTGQALRAARVIVDVRMHTAGWSREDAVKYLEKEAGQLHTIACREAYRYSRIPLQALSYYLGARQFETLFEEMKKSYGERLGDRFYQQVLMLGPVPPALIGDYLKSLPQ